MKTMTQLIRDDSEKLNHKQCMELLIEVFNEWYEDNKEVIQKQLIKKAEQKKFITIPKDLFKDLDFKIKILKNKNN